MLDKYTNKTSRVSNSSTVFTCGNKKTGLSKTIGVLNEKRYKTPIVPKIESTNIL